jgi:hypothetical protein
MRPYLLKTLIGKKGKEQGSMRDVPAATNQGICRRRRRHHVAAA